MSTDIFLRAKDESLPPLTFKMGALESLIDESGYIIDIEKRKKGDIYIGAHTLSSKETTINGETKNISYYAGGSLIVNTGDDPLFITHPPGTDGLPLVGQGFNTAPIYSNILSSEDGFQFITSDSTDYADYRFEPDILNFYFIDGESDSYYTGFTIENANLKFEIQRNLDYGVATTLNIGLNSVFETEGSFTLTCDKNIDFKTSYMDFDVPKINLINTNTQIIKSTSSSASWWNGRDYALIRHAHQGTKSLYYPTLSVDGQTVSWDMGTYTNDRLFFTCFSNADYTTNKTSGSANKNQPLAQIQFTKDGGLGLLGGIQTNNQQESKIYFSAYYPSNGATTHFTTNPISFISDPTKSSSGSGICVRIGAGGPVIVGGGECSTLIVNKLISDYSSSTSSSWSNDEDIYLASDSEIHCLTQCQGNDLNNSKELIISQGTICVSQATGVAQSTFGGYGTYTPTSTTPGLKGQVYFKIIT